MSVGSVSLVQLQGGEVSAHVDDRAHAGRVVQRPRTEVAASPHRERGRAAPDHTIGVGGNPSRSHLYAIVLHPESFVRCSAGVEQNVRALVTLQVIARYGSRQARTE